MENHFGSDHPPRRLKSYDVRGADLCKFYTRPPKSDCKPGDIILEPDENVEFITCHSYDKNSKQRQFVSKSIQTDYRESEAQTDPWDPPYSVTKVYSEPEVLALQKLSYGNGLPAGLLEVKYLMEKRELKSAETQLGIIKNDELFTNYKQIMCEEVRSEWSYRLSVKNQELHEKLAKMESEVVKDFRKRAEKKETCLKNLWMHKKDEMSIRNFKLEKKLHQELMALESGCKKSYNAGNGVQDFYKLDNDVTMEVQEKKNLTEGLDHVLLNYYLSNPTGFSTVKSWLEKKTNNLTTTIPLIRRPKQTNREKMAEKAYQNILDKKRTKLPPKIYREDFVKETTSTPSVKTENILEVFDFEEKKIDMVTVLHQALRGFAYQKQMLELIERHKDSLSTILPLSN